MYKSSWNVRNFKKGLRFVENIAKQGSVREVDYATGYAIASVKDMKSHGRITHAQQKALEDKRRPDARRETKTSGLLE